MESEKFSLGRSLLPTQRGTPRIAYSWGANRHPALLSRNLRGSSLRFLRILVSEIRTSRYCLRHPILLRQPRAPLICTSSCNGTSAGRTKNWIVLHTYSSALLNLCSPCPVLQSPLPIPLQKGGIEMLAPRTVTTFLLSTLALSACGGGGSSSSTPSTPATNVAGNYAGTLTDNLAGSGTATLDITQSGSTLGGTFSDVFSNASLNNAGTIAGTINGSTIQITLTGPTGSCPFAFTGTLSGTTISGSYASTTACTFPGSSATTDGGTITVTPAS